ncbi:uncharacterized protein LOC124647623 [Lolium rigidum]|uniref:uncharacterized protein LOC124647623 n=1 Tax=Lolium rigidum TaxID=89674 RepID=UPI001F5C8E82|nr:uncharacterized protein LOC124647623 [Lolium rigidum]
MVFTYDLLFFHTLQVMDHVGIEAHVCSSVAYGHWNIYIHVLELVWSGDASPKVRKSRNKEFILKVHTGVETRLPALGTLHIASLAALGTCSHRHLSAETYYVPTTTHAANNVCLAADPDAPLDQLIPCRFRKSAAIKPFTVWYDFLCNEFFFTRCTRVEAWYLKFFPIRTTLFCIVDVLYSELHTKEKCMSISMELIMVMVQHPRLGRRPGVAGIILTATPPMLFPVILNLPPSNADTEFFLVPVSFSKFDQVIDAYIGDLSRRVGDDRYLCAAWRSSFLLEAHRKGHKIKKNNKNNDHLAVRTGTIQRVIDEYFRREKAYFPVNISNNHWTTVIMHTPKQEFQVLDSLFPLSVTIDTVRALRQQISADIQEYNKSTSGFFPDVISWDIKSYDMPQQKDGNSCGLFVLQCMEHWDGDKWNKEISQEMINGSRNLINAQIVLATSNLLETVKSKVVRISKRFTK